MLHKPMTQQTKQDIKFYLFVIVLFSILIFGKNKQNEQYESQRINRNSEKAQ